MRAKAAKMGVTDRRSAGEKSLKSGPKMIPVNIRNRMSGNPVLLKTRLAKNPTDMIVPAIVKTIKASAI